MIGSTIKMCRFEESLETNNTISNAKYFSHGVIPFQLRTSESMTNETERLMVLKVVRV
jgi:hypothetical protein